MVKLKIKILEVSELPIYVVFFEVDERNRIFAKIFRLFLQNKTFAWQIGFLNFLGQLSLLT